MAKHRQLNTRFWDDNYIVNLDPIEKLLFLYILTNPLTSICGIYEVPLKRIAFDTGIDKDMVEKILSRFANENKVIYKDGWLAIINFLKYQSSSPTIQTGIENELKNVPNNLIQYIYPIDTVSNSYIDINKDIDKNIDKDKIVRFIKPTVVELKQYINEKNYSVDAENFIDFYESKGWMIGKSKMKNWKAAVRTWNSRNKADKKDNYKIL